MLQELVSFAIVLVVAVCVAGTVSVLYACGLQLLQPQTADGARGADTADSAGTANARSAGTLRRAGAVACFAACVAIVLVALYLIVGT